MPRPLRRLKRSETVSAAMLAIVVLASLLPVSISAASDQGVPNDRWTGRWDVEGDPNDDGAFDHFGEMELELDPTLDPAMPIAGCQDGDRLYRGTYEYFGGGTVEFCEVSELDHEMFGWYYTNNDLLGKVHMAHQGGSPEKWRGSYAEATPDGITHQPFSPWRGTRLGAPTCDAPTANSGARLQRLTGGEGCPDPVIFIPGFLGTEIRCGGFGFQLWPDLPTPEFDEMLLDATGAANFQGGSQCNRNATFGEVLLSAGTSDVYGGMETFLGSLPDVKSYLYPYDWRMSPGNPATQAGLGALVNQARVESGRKKVTLVAHSMGGLVARWYMSSPENAKKVARVVTLGSPLWGAPKPWLALSHGLTAPEEEDDSWLELDNIVPDEDLKAFAVNALGAYFLYPSYPYYDRTGGWLQLNLGDAPHPLGAKPTIKAVNLFGGNGELYRLALKQRKARLDTYFGRKWQMIVGTGIPTVATITENGDIADLGATTPTYRYTTGDGTVSKISARQGQTSGKIVHYVCGVAHASLPGDTEVQGMIRDFILTGGPIPNPHPKGC